MFSPFHGGVFGPGSGCDEILPDGDFLERPRSSRIYYRGKFYDYPIRPLNALRNLGPMFGRIEKLPVDEPEPS